MKVTFMRLDRLNVTFKRNRERKVAGKLPALFPHQRHVHAARLLERDVQAEWGEWIGAIRARPRPRVRRARFGRPRLPREGRRIRGFASKTPRAPPGIGRWATRPARAAPDRCGAAA